MGWLIAAAAAAHAGAALALVLTLAPELLPVLLGSPHPSHALALEPVLRHLLAVVAWTPRLAVVPVGAVVWRAAGPSGRTPAFRRWFAAGVAPLTSEPVARAVAALVAPRPVSVAGWVSRLAPPAPALTAALALGATACCWMAALAQARAAARGGDGPDLWDRRDAAAIIVWSMLVAVSAERIVAPSALAFALHVLS